MLSPEEATRHIYAGSEMGRKRSADDAPELAAGNGVLDRRALLAAAACLAGAGTIPARSAFGAAELSVEPWMTEPGAPFVGYGQPSKFEAKVVRTFASAPGTTGTGASRTPLQRLNGTITPNGLHFERHHSGIPDIDPDLHRLLIHGLVKRPLVFTLEALARYPMETRVAFIECGGNTGALYQKEPAQLDLQASHGLCPVPSGPGSGSRSCSRKRG
jgi:sulfane dehydrogenase subunit SoxC